MGMSSKRQGMRGPEVASRFLPSGARPFAAAALVLSSSRPAGQRQHGSRLRLSGSCGISVKSCLWLEEGVMMG